MLFLLRKEGFMNYRQVCAWAAYDLANTAFSALFVTFFFPFYVKEFLGGDEFQLGLMFGISILLVGLLVPFIGAWSDALKKRIPFIMVCTFLCCAAVIVVGYTPLAYALIAGGIANFFYHAALTTYNAQLLDVSTPKNRGFISGVGISFGYFGTLLSLGMAAIILSVQGWETEQGVRSVFVGTAVFFFLFACIMFLFFKEKTSHTGLHPLRAGLQEVKHTLKQVRKHVNVGWFMLSMLFFGDGMNAVILFLFLYARSIMNMPVQGFMIVYVIFSIAAMLGAFGAGKISDVLGAKKTLQYAGLLWMGVIIFLMYFSNLAAFIVAGSLGGIALGTIWTAMRPLTVQLSPHKNMGQFFGYLELTDKFSGVLGPIVFGYLAAHVSYTAALGSLLLFFIGGLLALAKVRL